MKLYEILIKLDFPKNIYIIAYDDKFLNNTTSEIFKYFKQGINKVL